jgi:hypothetical protein
MGFPGFDMIFRATTAAIEVLVQFFRPPTFEIGHDEARVRSGLAGFNAGNDTFDAAPTCCAVAELLEAPQLDCLCPGLEASFVLVSNASIWRRRVVVGATPKMKSSPFTRQKSITSGQQ